MPAISVRLKTSGPIYDRDVKAIVRKHMRKAKDDLGNELVRQVQRRLDQVLVNPTGYYRSQIDYLINQGNGAVIVHDRGVVYSSWLEGTSSRNQTTRFKGYRVFRTVMQQTERQADRHVGKEITAIVKELS